MAQEILNRAVRGSREGGMCTGTQQALNRNEQLAVSVWTENRVEEELGRGTRKTVRVGAGVEGMGGGVTVERGRGPV